MTIDACNLKGDSLPLTTKRLVLAQVSLCMGCCCGNVARGKPAVPVEWLKAQWRSRGFAKSIQFTISGCLGPCDLLNVIRISTADQDIWLGNMRTIEDYESLLEWAAHAKAIGQTPSLPPRLQDYRFSPFAPSSAHPSVANSHPSTTS